MTKKEIVDATLYTQRKYLFPQQKETHSRKTPATEETRLSSRSGCHRENRDSAFTAARTRGTILPARNRPRLGTDLQDGRLVTNDISFVNQSRL